MEGGRERKRETSELIKTTVGGEGVEGERGRGEESVNESGRGGETRLRKTKRERMKSRRKGGRGCNEEKMMPLEEDRMWKKKEKKRFLPSDGCLSHSL